MILGVDVMSSDPLFGLIQQGVLGIIVVLLVIYARGQVTRERDRSDKAETRTRELEDYIRNDYLPKQEKSNVLYNQTVDILQKALTQLTEMKSEQDYAQQYTKVGSKNSRRRRTDG